MERDGEGVSEQPVRPQDQPSAYLRVDSEMRQPLQVDPLVCAHGRTTCCLRCGLDSGEWLVLSPMDAATLLESVARQQAPDSVHEWLTTARDDASAQCDEYGQSRLVLPMPLVRLRDEVAAWMATCGLRMARQLGGVTWILAAQRESGC